MRDVTLTNLDRLGAAVDEAGEAFMMDEDAFRLFYDRTARPVWAYLARMTGDPRLADDLLQEAYYRLLRSRATHDSDDHRRNYLFRIATNLVHDARRRTRGSGVAIEEVAEPQDPQSTGDAAARAAGRLDLARALARMKPRERDLLWLAYANGSTHQEIAESLGLKAGSIKQMLFRARRRLATMMRDDRR